MLFNIKYWYLEEYLPTKRHRKLRKRYLQGNVDVEIKELTTEDFPVAFIIHDYKSISQNATSYDEFNDTEYKMFAEEIRTYNGNLFMPVRVTHGVAISMIFESFDYINRNLTSYKPCWKYGEDFTEQSIVKSNSICEDEFYIMQKAEKYVIYDNKVWQICGEPMYEIVTFGLGYNHGGTGFFITQNYNNNISKNNYFNALEREKAIEYGKQIALKRGDTDSVDIIGENDIIEVLMPEMVKRNPQKEHGDGDEFINSIESIINNTNSALEAGLLSITSLYEKKM